MPRARSLTVALALVVLSLSLAGCGDGGRRMPDISALPLPPGASVVARAHRCDPGANAYCAQELVIQDLRYPSSQALLQAERHLLHRRGWTGSYADNGLESSDYSPGNSLHVTFSSADEDLQAIDLGWVHRQRVIVDALSREIFHRHAALSVYLEIGPG